MTAAGFPANSRAAKASIWKMGARMAKIPEVKKCRAGIIEFQPGLVPGHL
jgi:hypothetical protein